MLFSRLGTKGACAVQVQRVSILRDSEERGPFPRVRQGVRTGDDVEDIKWGRVDIELPQSPACWSFPYTDSASERTACVRSCINEACYADVYGDDPLEEVTLLFIL